MKKMAMLEPSSYLIDYQQWKWLVMNKHWSASDQSELLTWKLKILSHYLLDTKKCEWAFDHFTPVSLKIKLEFHCDHQGTVRTYNRLW